MFKAILKLMSVILFILAVIFLHLFVINFLPHPFNQIHIVFVTVIWLIMFTAKPGILWVGLPLAFFLELFSSVPFGINIVALMLVFFILSRFLLTVFTNRSLIIVLLTGLLGMVLYRLIFFGLLFLVSLFNRDFVWPGSEMFVERLWEISLTGLSLFVLYFLSSHFIKRLNPMYINIRGKRLYER